MASLVLNGNTSGSVTISSPAVSGTTTLTLPTTSGTVMVNGPAFSAYSNTDQTISTSTTTKIQYGTEFFDTASAFDAITNYRFTPLVAGYYQVNATMQMQNNALGVNSLVIYKNGSSYFTISTYANNGTANAVVSGGQVIYMNGSTDYLEMYCRQTSGGNLTLYGLASNGGYNGFSACLVRSA